MIFKILNISLFIFLFILKLGRKYFVYCNKYVELSAASINYIAYLPVVVKAWKRIGFCSIVILLYHNLTKQILYVQEKLRNEGSDIILLHMKVNISLHYTSKIARIFGFIINKEYLNTDYFILSDSDMIPVSSSFYKDLNYNKLTIKSVDINGYGYGMNKGRWAICYMVASKYIWKDILKNDIISKNNIINIINRVTEHEILKGESYFENFQYIDEVYMRDRIKEWKYFNSNVLFHKRNYKNTRIDRSQWPKDILLMNKSSIIDIHLPKLNINIMKLWKNKIIPLQQLIFNFVPYNMDYINRLCK